MHAGNQLLVEPALVYTEWVIHHNVSLNILVKKLCGLLVARLHWVRQISYLTRQSEVANFSATVFVDENVSGLEIAMDNASRMHVA
jgi:hypothetical protein